MTIYAVGKPGQMPRQWVEASSERDLKAQCQSGEVIAAASIDASGRPVPEALPAA
jgi:hypothetical protein